jgi:NADPH2:quinone reductase
MDQAVWMSEPGGVDRLVVAAHAPAAPGPGEIRARHEAIGVNFLDTYHRTGLYPLPRMPWVLGVEGAGVVEAVGEGVTDLAAGDRIAYAGAPVGAYASTRLLPRARAVRLPDDIPARLAAATLLRGLTAHMLFTRTHRLAAGDTILVHAAAGGLGAVLVRWASHVGARVIGTASTEEKAARAQAHGADHVIVGRDTDIVGEVKELTGGMGVDFAIDGIGGAMLRRSIDCLRPFGIVASIGQPAGPIPPVPVEALSVRGLARPSVMAYVTEPAGYAAGSAAVFAMMRAGVVAEIGGEYRLADAASAHADLEAGRSVGSLLLIP